LEIDAMVTNNRKLLFGLVLILVSTALSLIVVETAGLIYFASRSEGVFYLRDRQPLTADDTVRLAESQSRLAPYFGITKTPGVTVADIAQARPTLAEELSNEYGPHLPEWMDLQANNYGFLSEYDYPLDSQGLFVIGISGGSVADRFSVQGRSTLLARLARVSDNVRILNFAQGGHKQPQQLLILSYFLSIGQRFDVIVNVDGLNESTLGSQNEESGVHYSMPWARRIRSLDMIGRADTDEGAALQLARLTLVRHKARTRENAAHASRWAAQYMFNDLLHRFYTSKFDELTVEPRSRDQTSPVELIHLVPNTDGTEESIPLHWARCSTMMLALANDAGARYLHVLQPNQYFGSRVFTNSEARIALKSRSPFRRAVVNYYPALLEHGPGLSQAGVEFIDATPLFDDLTEAAYVDDCCHYTQLGNDLLAELLADHIQPIVQNYLRTASR
jgi:hypothetical protein